MERNFAGEGGSSAGFMTPARMGLDEAYLKGYLSDLKFQSVLQPLYFDNQSLTPATEEINAYAFSPATFGYFMEDIPECSAVTFSKLNRAPATTYQFLNREEIKIPEEEAAGLDAQDFAFQLLKLNENSPQAAFQPPEPLINFFSTSSSSTVENLMSINNSSESESQFAYQSGAAASLNHDVMNVEVQRQLAADPVSSYGFPTWGIKSGKKRYKPYKLPSSGMARDRRLRISEKTRSLQRVLPWDKKMDTGTMLEEAYKYVKFLQAQISVLQNMPEKTSSSSSRNKNPSYDVSRSCENSVVWGDLGKLNRQQLLEVVVNSPVAQTAMYSSGCCIYSTEQLVLLKKKMAEEEKKKTVSDDQVRFASHLLFY